MSLVTVPSKVRQSLQECPHIGEAGLTTPRKRLLHELLGTIDSNTELPGRPAGGDVGVIARRVLLPRKRAWKICGRPPVGHASDGDDPRGLAGQKVVPG